MTQWMKIIQKSLILQHIDQSCNFCHKYDQCDHGHNLCIQVRLFGLFLNIKLENGKSN